MELREKLNLIWAGTYIIFTSQIHVKVEVGVVWMMGKVFNIYKAPI